MRVVGRGHVRVHMLRGMGMQLTRLMLRIVIKQWTKGAKKLINLNN